MVEQETQGIPQSATQIGTSGNVPSVESRTWSTVIPGINKFFLILSALFVFGLDLLLLIGSPGLISFWIEMLVVFGIFMIFFFVEGSVLRKRFASTSSRLDFYICFVIILRNIAFFLNFIPFIQLIGMMILFYAGIPFLIIYLLLIRFR